MWRESANGNYGEGRVAALRTARAEAKMKADAEKKSHALENRKNKELRMARSKGDIADKPMSDKQKRILEFIQRFNIERHMPPTIRDIQMGCGISSTSVVDYNLQRLEWRGAIKRRPEVSRGIELLGEFLKPVSNVARLPLFGSVARGGAIDAPTDWDWAEDFDTVDVPADLVERRERVYALRVKGDGFSDSFIMDGDLLALGGATEVGDDDMALVDCGEGAAIGRLSSLRANGDVRVVARVVGLVRECA